MLSMSLLIFAGCFGGGQTGELEDPVAGFAELIEAHRMAWQKAILEILPQIESYQKSETRFAINGKAEVDQAGGAIDFDFVADGKSDMTDPTDPKMEANLALDAALEGDAFNGSASAAVTLKVVNASVFLSLESLDVDFPNIPTSEILAPIKPLLGKWYGDSFDTINDQVEQEALVEEMLVGRLQGPSEMRERIGTIIADTELFTMNEYLGVEEGIQKFDVTVNNAELIDAGNQIIDLFTVSEAEKERMKAELQNDLANITISGTLGILATEPKYFTFDGIVVDAGDPTGNADIAISFMQKQKTFAINQASSGWHTKLEIASTGNTHDFTILGGETAEETIVIVQGSKSPSAFTFSLTDPETNTERVAIALTKDRDGWSGTITSTDQPENVIEVSGLTFDEKSFATTLIVKNNDEVLATISVSYEVDEASSVLVTPPESFDPFADLIGNFLPMMMMGAPGIGAPPGALPVATSTPGQPADFPLDEPALEDEVDAPGGTERAPLPPTLPEGVTIEGLPEGMTEADIQTLMEANGIELPQ